MTLSAHKCTQTVTSYHCGRKRCERKVLFAGKLQHMAGSGSAGINGLPRISPTEYEENGRLYSTFRRYATWILY